MASKKQATESDLMKADFEALAQFRYRLRLFLRFSEDTCNAAGITPLQYQLMLQTKGYPGRQWASLTELAERLQSKHHGVVALVSRCEAMGLVRRQKSDTDARLVEVHLTAKGEKKVAEVARLHRSELALQSDFVAIPVLARFKGKGSEGTAGKNAV